MVGRTQCWCWFFLLVLVHPWPPQCGLPPLELLLKLLLKLLNMLASSLPSWACASYLPVCMSLFSLSLFSLSALPSILVALGMLVVGQHGVSCSHMHMGWRWAAEGPCKTAGRCKQR